MNAKKRKSYEEGAISKLSDDLLCKILSSLSTKEGALTSVLSKRWRDLFKSVPSIDFDDSISVLGERSEEFERTSNSITEFMNTRPITEFSLRCHKSVDKDLIEDLILKALRRGTQVLTVTLLFPSRGYSLPCNIFSYGQNLVKLKLGCGNLGSFDKLFGGDCLLSKLKTLHLDSVNLGLAHYEFARLLSKCPVLEELIVNSGKWNHWMSSSVSAPTLKRLIFDCEHDLSKLPTDIDHPIELSFYYGTWAPYKVSFDTPNLLYLDYSDFLAQDYPLVKLDSLIEARLDVGLAGPFMRLRHSDCEDTLSWDVTNLIMGIHNVQTLHISSDTLEVISDFCKTLPVFHNLKHLSIQSNDERGWQALPLLLINCPNLHTLVFHGLHHRVTDGCGDACDCISPPTSSCLSSCPVKVLKILEFGATCAEMSLVEHLLNKLPRLEQMVIVLHSQEEDFLLVQVSQALEIAPRASPNCKFQVFNYFH